MVTFVVWAGEKGVNANLAAFLPPSGRIAVNTDPYGPQIKADCVYLGVTAALELGVIAAIPEPGFLAFLSIPKHRAGYPPWAVVGRLASDELYHDTARVVETLQRIGTCAEAASENRNLHIETLGVYLDWVTKISADNVADVAAVLAGMT